jgi:hypothetical protein
MTKVLTNRELDVLLARLADKGYIRHTDAWLLVHSHMELKRLLDVVSRLDLYPAPAIVTEIRETMKLLGG